jgi:hypothetical protein
MYSQTGQPRGREPAIPEMGSASVLGEGMGWMPRITSAIFPTNVGDYCIRMLSFDLEGRNERVFGIHENVIRFALQIQTDGVMRQHWLIPANGLPSIAASGKHHIDPVFACSGAESGL